MEIKCMICGKPADFWLDLGDFVMGWPDTIIPICKKDLKPLMNRCIYQPSKWKYSMRYWPVAGREVDPEVESLFQEELERIDGRVKVVE